MPKTKQIQEEPNRQAISDEKIDLLFEKLDKVIFWLRFSNKEIAKEYFDKILNTDRKKEIYQLTDGKKGIAELMRMLNIKSKSMIPDLYSDWIKKGILIESSINKDRKMKVVDLKELGL